MYSSPAFLRIRAIAFSLIIVINLLWISLLCTYVYLEWDAVDTAERPIIAVMLLTDTLTVIMLLILLILPFRPWLDGARFLFLLIAHIGIRTAWNPWRCANLYPGIAGAFAFWNPRFQCPTSSADSEGVCRLLNVYILIASWVIPVFLVAYVSGLAYAMVRCSQPNASPMMERESILPVMRLEPNSRVGSYTQTTAHGSLLSPTEKAFHRGSAEEQRKHISGMWSGRSSLSHNSLTKMPPAAFLV
ncbi:hypothetical protein GGX14DRAFT_434854 [Mycena pura]|uniref:Uncharacterized protein n=1 Tax=Mycena pura TaxID=153505 RepID=A0AAD6VPD6_9AGAR|nr:hypothetical protein GGX14DRAFT_434854 [Mycena pura]